MVLLLKQRSNIGSITAVSVLNPKPRFTFLLQLFFKPMILLHRFQEFICWTEQQLTVRSSCSLILKESIIQTHLIINTFIQPKTVTCDQCPIILQFSLPLLQEKVRLVTSLPKSIILSSEHHTSLQHKIRSINHALQIHNGTVNFLVQSHKHIHEALCFLDIELSDTAVEMLLKEKHSAVEFRVLFGFFDDYHVALGGDRSEDTVSHTDNMSHTLLLVEDSQLTEATAFGHYVLDLVKANSHIIEKIAVVFDEFEVNSAEGRRLFIDYCYFCMFIKSSDELPIDSLRLLINIFLWPGIQHHNLPTEYNIQPITIIPCLYQMPSSRLTRRLQTHIQLFHCLSTISIENLLKAADIRQQVFNDRPDLRGTMFLGELQDCKQHLLFKFYVLFEGTKYVLVEENTHTAYPGVVGFVADLVEAGNQVLFFVFISLFHFYGFL